MVIGINGNSYVLKTKMQWIGDGRKRLCVWNISGHIRVYVCLFLFTVYICLNKVRYVLTIYMYIFPLGVFPAVSIFTLRCVVQFYVPCGCLMLMNDCTHFNDVILTEKIFFNVLFSVLGYLPLPVLGRAFYRDSHSAVAWETRPIGAIHLALINS